MPPLYILYLDRHHLGDALFLKSLAQHLASEQGGGPACLLVHGSGEKVERTLEAQGLFPERTEGVLDIEGEDQRRLVERAVREMNQEVVGTLTDEVVSAVGIQGVDRGLFQQNEEGDVRATNPGWVSALLKQHIVPVVSALVRDPSSGDVEEFWAADAVVALAEALEASFDPVACLLTNTDHPGVSIDDSAQEELALNEVPEDAVPEPAAVRRLSEADVPLLVTTLKGLFQEDPEGTYIRP